jgi:ferritin-like metal-binding protein YciE
MPKMDSIDKLFEHELEDIYDAELKLVDALKKQAAECTTPVIREGFQAHQKETRAQVERLEKAFEAYGKEPSRGKGCAGIDGLLEEHKEFGAEKPSPEIFEIFNLTAAAKVERYEITAYESLIRLASQLGLDDVVPLLEENLAEEQATLSKVVGLSNEESRFEGLEVEAE